MKRVMYMVEIATYENGKDIMDYETIRKKIYESLKANNATVRIAQMEYGSLGSISVETSFNGVKMFYCRQPLGEWKAEYKSGLYGLSNEGNVK